MDLNPETTEVIQWIYRMVEKYGGIVIDQNGREYDWGQALMRECLGPDWITKAQQMDDAPTREHLQRAMLWEQGEWPEWVRGTNRFNREEIMSMFR